mmetsp:Transcript_5116/g.9630  ORF Transcript_5116/g.9630 Transcript_5116/m.9630 type:complete len:1019 (+) Transcript_5116:55-3111(+)
MESEARGALQALEEHGKNLLILCPHDGAAAQRLAEQIGAELNDASVAAAPADKLSSEKLQRENGVWWAASIEEEVLESAGEVIVWQVDWKRYAIFRAGYAFTLEDLKAFAQLDSIQVKWLVREGFLQAVEGKFFVEDTKQTEVLDTVEPTTVTAWHNAIVEKVAERTSRKVWEDKSDYVINALVFHVAAIEEPARVHNMVLNINWVISKAIRSVESLQSLVDLDVPALKHIVPKEGQILSRALWAFITVSAHVLEVPKQQARQVFAEFMWHKLSGCPSEDRIFHLFRYNCNLVRKRAVTSNEPTPTSWLTTVHAHQPVLSSANAELLHCYHDVSTSCLNAVACSGTDRIAATNSRGEVILVNAHTGCQELKWDAHPGWTCQALLSCDVDNTLVTAGHDGTCKVWKENQLCGEFKAHDDAVRCLALAPPNTIISGADDGSVMIWRTDALESPMRQFVKAHNGWCLDVAVQTRSSTTDDLCVASCSDDNTICLWRSALKISEPEMIRHHSNFVTALTFCEDLLASGSADASICIWDLSGEEVKLRFTLEGHMGTITSLVYNKGLLLSASDDHSLRVWDIVNGKEDHSLKGHSDTVNKLTVVPERFEIGSGLVVASASDDYSVILWDIESQTALACDEGTSCEADNSIPDSLLVITAMQVHGNLLALGSKRGILRIYDLSSGFVVSTLAEESGYPVEVIAMNSELIAASAGSNYEVHVWESLSWDCKYTLAGHMARISALHFDKGFILSGSRDDKVIAWDASSGERRQVLSGHSGKIMSISDVGHIEELQLDQLVLTTSSDKTIRMWDLKVGHEIKTLTGHTQPVQKVFWFGKQKHRELCVSFSKGCSVRIWDLVWGEQLHLLHTGDSPAVGLEIDFEQQLAYVATAHGKILGFDSHGGQVLHRSSEGVIFSGMTCIRTPEALFLACAAENAKAFTVFSVSGKHGKTENTGPLLSTQNVYGSFDHPHILGPMTNILAVSLDSECTSETTTVSRAVLCTSFATCGHGIFDLVFTRSSTKPAE